MINILIQIIIVLLTMSVIGITMFGIAYVMGWAMNEDIKHAVSGKEWPASRGYISLVLFILMVISVTTLVILLKA